MKFPAKLSLQKIKSAAFTTVCGTLLVAATLPAVAQTKYTSTPKGCDVKIEGTSSLHDWEMEGSLIGGFLEFGPGVQLDPAQATVGGITGDKVPATGRVIIPVRSVHSKADHLPDVMEHLMQDALKEPQFPRIEFNLKEMAFKGPHEAGKPFNFEVTGDLSISGVTNAATFPITITQVDADTIKVSGTAPVNLPQYNITPPAPSFGLGLMKTGPDVKIIFDWSLHKKQ
ncbi:MAG TPA: YceI family protein [Verrucomicrobiae bacterium]|jgi:polyisoprenoid-binding protein YceI